MAWQDLNIDEGEIKKRNAKAKEKQVMLAKAYHDCFHSKAGQLVIADLTNKFIMNNPTALNAPNVTYEAGYHNGEAGIIHYILRLMTQAELL